MISTDPTDVLKDNDKSILPDKTTIHDTDIAPSDNIVEISPEEAQAEKRSGGGFLKNLQRNIGGLFKSDNQTEAENSNVNDA